MNTNTQKTQTRTNTHTCTHKHTHTHVHAHTLFISSSMLALTWAMSFSTLFVWFALYVLWMCESISLQHTVTLCNKLWHNATHCNWKHTSTHCNFFFQLFVVCLVHFWVYLTATHCNTLQLGTHCNELRFCLCALCCVSCWFLSLNLFYLSSMFFLVLLWYSNHRHRRRRRHRRRHRHRRRSRHRHRHRYNHKTVT